MVLFSYYLVNLHFDQFLEEAKLHAKESTIFQASSASSEENEEKRKKKKSWKNLLLPWWKVVEKKRKPEVEPPAANLHASYKRKSYVSGQVYSNSVKFTENKQSFSTSGPLTSLFNSSRKADNEIPYMCLDHLGSPNPTTETYGPVYLVT